VNDRTWQTYAQSLILLASFDSSPPFRSFGFLSLKICKSYELGINLLELGHPKPIYKVSKSSLDELGKFALLLK
jgi:hypothetical protein